MRSSSAPLVSGVLIFLNGRTFLAEAIESVLAQHYPSWELMLVDDGSTDGSSEIARRYADAHPKSIRYFNHPGHKNLGKSTSRNLGIRNAQGRYIAFLDADDVWLPQKLEKQVEVLTTCPTAVMVYGPTLYWYSWDENGSDVSDAVSHLGMQGGAVPGGGLLERFLKRPGIVPGICSLLASTEATQAVGGFDESIQYMYEDQTLIAKLCLAGDVVVDSGCWDRYRQHGGSTSAAAIAEGYYHPWRPNAARLAYLRWLQNYLALQSAPIEDLARLVQREIRMHERPMLGTIAGGMRMLRERFLRLIE